MPSVTVSFEQELYEKVCTVQNQIEAEKLKAVKLSAVVSELVKLGFAYREFLRGQKTLPQEPKHG